MLDGAELEFDMVPTAAVVNPVFLLNNWPSDGVRMAWGSRDVDAGRSGGAAGGGQPGCLGAG